jgi:hypothetical protein
MMIFFRKHMRIIFTVTIIAFIGGIFLGVSNYILNPKIDYIAKINGKKIPIRLYNSIYENSEKMHYKMINAKPSENDLKEIKIKIIQALVQDEIFYQQAKVYGIVVTNEELKADLQNSYLFKDGDVFSKNKYMAFLSSIQMKPREYEILRKKQIISNKVKLILVSAIKLWNYEIESNHALKLPIAKNDLFQAKVNTVLNEWYSKTIRNAKIITNDLIFK